MAKKPDEMREVKAAIAFVMATAGLCVLWVVLYRVLVPSILEAHFYGSVALATVVGIAGAGGLVWLAVFAIQRIGRWLK